MDQLEKQEKIIRKFKKQLKIFAKKIGELEGKLEDVPTPYPTGVISVHPVTHFIPRFCPTMPTVL